MTPILVDTSIWIDHLRQSNKDLSLLLLETPQLVTTHSFVIGELACGSLKNRKNFLRYLSYLYKLPNISNHECMSFLESNQLYSMGIGFIDVHLLGSTIISKAKLWTFDKRLQKVADLLDISF